MTDPENAAIAIDYFSDVLCIWAWIAQPRLEELHREYGERVQIRHRFVDIFGNSHEKIPRQWGGEGSFERFADHVAQVASGFEHARVHEDVWRRLRPPSSLQAHLFLKAVEINGGPQGVELMAHGVRQAFFCRGRNIGDLGTLLDIAENNGIEHTNLKQAIDDGRAIAALSADMRSAADQAVKGSPTWVLNDGRQVLYGNIGYRILSANIEEMLKHPGNEASWC